MLDWFQSLGFSDQMEVVKILAAALAFVIGLSQYRKGQIWKRLEFVSAEMKIFFNDPAVRDAMNMLDWRKKRIPLFKFRDEADDQYVTVAYKMVAAALGIAPEAQYDKKQSAIREAFERFLEYLARFEGFIEATAIKPKDLNPYLDYWMKLISGHDDHSPEVTKEVLPSLWKFIDYYGYRDVRRLVDRYHPVAFPKHSN
ncbi:MAG TPA: hypothetical protein VMB47_01190 [Candidatus Aquilonibacter sp.]|nr:hypothetical protein [Candidatus Aquilonibacter sp.]